MRISLIILASFRHTNDCFQTTLDESQPVSFMGNLQNKNMLAGRAYFERISLRPKSQPHESSLLEKNVVGPPKPGLWLVWKAKLASQLQLAGPPSRWGSISLSSHGYVAVCLAELWIWNSDAGIFTCFPVPFGIPRRKDCGHLSLLPDYKKQKTVGTLLA